MIRCPLALVSEINLLDARTNTVSFINLMEEINSQGFPAFIPLAACHFLLTKSPDDQGLTDPAIVVLLNDGQVFRSPVNVDFQNMNRTRVMVQLNGLAVTGPGTLTFRFVDGDAALGEWSVQVTQIAPPEPQVRLG